MTEAKTQLNSGGANKPYNVSDNTHLASPPVHPPTHSRTGPDPVVDVVRALLRFVCTIKIYSWVGGEQEEESEMEYQTSTIESEYPF